MTRQPQAEKFELVTLGHIRLHGCRDLLVYCGSINCNHSTTMNADHMPDDTPIAAARCAMVCTKCGHVGADVRRTGHRMSTSVTFRPLARSTAACISCGHTAA